MRRIVGHVCLLLALVSTVRAADFGCGVDTDRNGSVDHACGTPDADGDAYPTTGHTGPYGTDVDCDDNDFFMHTGESTTAGCSAGNYRTCASTGSYGACGLLTAFSCKSGTGADFWVDPAGVTTAGCGGTSGAPCNYTCTSNAALACYHALNAGDCVIFKPGTYSGSTFTSAVASPKVAQIEVNARTGTAANHIKFVGLPGIPGTYPKIVGAGSHPGTCPTENGEMQGVIYIFNSPYVDVADLEIDGTGGFENSGIHVDGGGANVKAGEYHNLYIHNIKGCSDNNLSAIKCRVDTDSCWIHHNLLLDDYDTNGSDVAASQSQNNVPITIMNDIGTVKIDDNIIGGPTSEIGGCARIKHAEDTCVPYFRRNQCYNAGYGFASENATTTMTNNLVINCNNNYGFRYVGIGDVTGWFKDSTFNYNTVSACALISVSANWDDSTNHRSYSGATVFTADHNIMSDTNASYDGDEGDGTSRANEYNCTHGEYAASRGKFVWTNNIYYSSGTSSLRFGDHGQAGGGADYGGLASWQAAGYDAGSHQADPALGTTYQSVTYSGFGWRANEFDVGASPSPSPSPTPTPTPTPGGTVQASINFRATSGYVTDGAGETYCLGNLDIYPTNRASLTFGWDGAIGDMGRDRNNAVDRRLAGMNQAANDGVSQTAFRLDLPQSGTKVICLALGDATTTTTYQYLQVLDNTTPLFTITDTDGTAAAHFDDANSVDLTTTTWPTTQTCKTVSMSTTTLKLKLGSPGAQPGSSFLAHLDVSLPAASPTPTPTPNSFPQYRELARRFKDREP